MRRRRRGRRVVTPNGRVWFVRRRRARRRPFWAHRPPERYHGEEELPDPDEKLPVPNVMDLFTYAEDDLGERGFDRWYDDREAADVSLTVIAILAAVVGLLAWLTVRYVLPCRSSARHSALSRSPWSPAMSVPGSNPRPDPQQPRGWATSLSSAVVRAGARMGRALAHCCPRTITGRA